MTWDPDASATLVGYGVAVLAFGLAGFLVLGYESYPASTWHRFVDRAFGRGSGVRSFSWIDLRLLTVLAAVGVVGFVAAYGLAGGYVCTPTGPPDAITLLTSGRAFLARGDPFTIAACGLSGNPVPSGIASVLLDALGSLGGVAGILAVWAVVAVALVPLLWFAGGPQRRIATVFVLASFLYYPIVGVQLDGDALALVPLTVLLALVLSRRPGTLAAVVGGFLSTGRFSAIFPVAAVAGLGTRRRWWPVGVAAAVFAAASLATYAVYGDAFLRVVFLLQFGRTHLALNYWGILWGAGRVTLSPAVTILQALLVVALVAVCWARARSQLGAAAIVLTGTLLLTQVLPFTELVFLLPVALLGTRRRWWLLGIGLTGATNYLIVWMSLGQSNLLSYALDLILTGLLLGLLADLMRQEFGAQRPDAGPEPVIPPQDRFGAPHAPAVGASSGAPNLLAPDSSG